jgi:hypothetical protein
MTPSIPRARVKRLNPAFAKAKRLGAVTRPQAVARLNRDAEFARAAQLVAAVEKAVRP